MSHLLEVWAYTLNFLFKLPEFAQLHILLKHSYRRVNSRSVWMNPVFSQMFSLLDGKHFLPFFNNNNLNLFCIKILCAVLFQLYWNTILFWSLIQLRYIMTQKPFDICFHIQEMHKLSSKCIQRPWGLLRKKCGD